MFDAVGTLIYPDPPVATAYGTIARRFDCDLPDDEIDRRFRQAFKAQELLDSERFGNRTSELREHQRWQRIVAAVFGEMADGQKLFSALWDHFGCAENWRVFDDVLPVWTSLERLGVRLAIGSNFDSRLQRVCAGLAPLDRAEYLFISSRVGWRKPARQFFGQAAAELRVLPEEVAMVGDDVVNDYHASKAAGWRAVRLDRTGGTVFEGEIGRLSELLTPDGNAIVG